MSLKRRLKRLDDIHKAELSRIIEAFHSDVIDSGYEKKSPGYASIFKSNNQEWITYCRKHKIENEQAFKTIIENSQ